MERAILAGGCFWGVQALLRRQPGVVGTRVGYTGGTLPNPRYADICTGRTGHAEAISVDFDPDKTSYAAILQFFFRIHDPTTLNRQGNDRGAQYRSEIFYTSPEQQAIARDVIRAVDGSGFWPAPVVTALSPAGPFYEAEDDHQDYLEKHPGGYTCHWVRG